MKHEEQVREIKQKFEILLKEINDTRWLRDKAWENYEDAVPRLDSTALKKYARQMKEHDAKLKELYERREQLHTEERNIRYEHNKTITSRLSVDDLKKILKERGVDID